MIHGSKVLNMFSDIKCRGNLATVWKIGLMQQNKLNNSGHKEYFLVYCVVKLSSMNHSVQKPIYK